MDLIPEYATTPLALASLIAILIVGLLKVLTSGKNNALNRMTTHYGFALVLCFGLLGNLAYLYDSYQSSETLIRGSVVDKNGQYLSDALIDTGGHGHDVTGASGDFLLAIPKSRVQEDYLVSASLRGYEKQEKKVKNKSRIFVRFELEKSIFDPADSMSIGDPRIFTGHYLGLPDVTMQVRFSNSTTDALQFQNLDMEIVSPSGETRHLVQASISMGFNAQPLFPTPNIYLNPSEERVSSFRFIQYDDSVLQLASNVEDLLESNPQFRVSGYDIDQRYLSEDIVERLNSTLSRSWFWEPGESVVRLTASVGGVPVIIERHITLTADDITSMKNISEYYPSGFGIFYEESLTPVGRAIPGRKILSLPLQ